MLLLTTILIALIAIYFIYDMVGLIGEKQFSLGRSRTYAILIGLVLCGRMIYSFFTDDFTDEGGVSNRGHFVMGLLGVATLYTLGDLCVALFTKKDGAFIRRKLTFFLFMLVLLVFYVWTRFAF